QPHRELIYIYGMQMRRADIDAQFRALSRLTSLTYDQVFLWSLSRGVTWEPSEVASILGGFVAADPGDRPSRLALAATLVRLAERIEPGQREALFGLGNALRLAGDAAAAEPYLKATKDLDALDDLLQRAATPAGQADRKLPLALGAACEALGRRAVARAWYKV